MTRKSASSSRSQKKSDDRMDRSESRRAWLVSGTFKSTGNPARVVVEEESEQAAREYLERNGVVDVSIVMDQDGRRPVLSLEAALGRVGELTGGVRKIVAGATGFAALYAVVAMSTVLAYFNTLGCIWLLGKWSITELLPFGAAPVMWMVFAWCVALVCFRGGKRRLSLLLWLSRRFTAVLLIAFAIATVSMALPQPVFLFHWIYWIFAGTGILSTVMLLHLAFSGHETEFSRSRGAAVALALGPILIGWALGMAEGTRDSHPSTTSLPSVTDSSLPMGDWRLLALVDGSAVLIDVENGGRVPPRFAFRDPKAVGVLGPTITSGQTVTPPRP